MIKKLLIVITSLSSLSLPSSANNKDYREGSDFAKQIQGQGTDILKNTSPESIIPNYNSAPDEKKYYGGITSGGDDSLKSDATIAWSNSDIGQTVNESFINNSKEPISYDAPFIQAGRDIESKAESIIGNTGQCQGEKVSHSEFTNYICERDTQVEQSCIRTAEIVGSWIDDVETKTFQLSHSYFSFNTTNTGWAFNISAPATGKIISASLFPWKRHDVTAPNRFNSHVNFLNNNFYLNITTANPIHLNPNGMEVKQGQKIEGSACMSPNGEPCKGRSGEFTAKTFSKGVHLALSLNLTMEVKTKKYFPEVKWTEFCPFDKKEGVKISSECIKAGGTQEVVFDGKMYHFTEACWQYEDRYVTQSEDPGSCKIYMDDPACTLATRQCAFTSEEGYCLHEHATFSCETKTEGTVLICGGEQFCLDGSCENVKNGVNNDFKQAVSELAAVAAAGKDVAELNTIDVKAFTGKARFCKKYATGYSNCCKDSGWGQDIGLTKCSGEEKALGKAKENKLTVSVGEFCSKKVLGVCLERKRSYCQFDSKLAQIVQQQGRAWQLGINFGSAKNPNCRGITVDELQHINFDRLDFSNFYEDLIKNQNVPNNNELLQKVKDRMNQQLEGIAK